MPYRQTPLVTARLQASRRRVLDAATRLVAEGGYAALTVDEVARRAEVATGTVYRHFAGKAALVTEVFDRVAAEELAAVRAAAAPPGPVAERLRRAVRTFALRALRRPRLAYALLAEPVDPAVEQERLAFRRSYRDVFADLLTDGVRRQQLPPQHVPVSAAALVGAIGEALVGPLAAPGPDDAATVEDIVTLCLRAVGATTEASTMGERSPR